LKMRDGDFSELLTDPYVTGFFGGPVQIFDNSVPCCSRPAIPGNRLDLYQNALGQSIIDPAGLAITRLFPLPTSSGVFRNFRTTSTLPATTNYYVAKFDHIVSDKQRVTLSLTRRGLSSVKGGFPRFPEPWVAVGRWNQNFTSYYARLQHDYTFTPTLLNHLNLGFTRSFVENFNTTRGLSPVPLGLPANATQNRGLPMIGFPNYGDSVTSRDPRSYQGGGSTFFDNTDGDNAVQIDDFVTWVKGRHTMKFGGGLRFQQLNDSGHFDIGGQFNFQHVQTANGDFSGRQGWPIASLITGAPEFSFNSVQSIDPGFRFFTPGMFFQDDIKVTPKLTLNLGVRYDIPYPRVEHVDKYRHFDPTVANPAAGGRLGAIVGAGGQGGLQAEFRGLMKTDYSNFSPRFGFAYAVNEKTVVRGGYGLYYAPLLYDDFGRAGGIGYNLGSNPINGGFDAFIKLSTFPAIPTPDPNTQFIGGDVDTFDRNFRTGRTAQWSLDLQRELPWNIVASASYVGSKGTRLRSNFRPPNALPLEALRLGEALLRKNLNDVDANDRAYAQSVGITLPASSAAVFPGFGGNVAQALKPFPQYNRVINHMESEGQSIYHALKLDLQRRFAQGFQLGLSYTFSKLITDAAEDLFGATPISGVLQNPYDREALRTISPNSIPHSFVASYIYEFPIGKGRRYLNQGGIADAILGGWQVTGVHRYHTGPALVPFIAGGSRDFLDLVGFGGNLRPNLTGQPFLTDTPAGGESFRYLNPGAFARPPGFGGGFGTGDIGSAAYRAYYANPLRFFGNASPTYNNFRFSPFLTEDFSLMKKTRLTETVTLELRMELFNAFNRGRFGIPELNIDNGLNYGFTGRNGDFNQPRRIQLGARVIF
jgi:TonB dependent receptor